MRSKLLLSILSIILVCCGGNEGIDLDLSKNPQNVEIFGEEFISTRLYERDIAISPNGDELIYSMGDYKQRKRCLVQIRKVEGKWSGPEVISFSGIHQDIEPFYAENGNKLYFASNRPVSKNSERVDYNIWYSEREGIDWSNPKMLSEKINTEQDEFYPSLSANGNLYFTSVRKNGIGREDIFLSKKEKGEFQEPQLLDSTINTKYYEFNSYINPEENILIFSSFGRPDGLGGGDLYYSKKDENGKWSKAKNMGTKVNSEKLDYCPFLDVKRNNFYFTSERISPYNDRLNNIDELIKLSNRTQNGMGDIYRIGMDELDLN